LFKTFLREYSTASKVIEANMTNLKSLRMSVFVNHPRKCPSAKRSKLAFRTFSKGLDDSLLKRVQF
jgi:hypothetical protein